MQSSDSCCVHLWETVTVFISEVRKSKRGNFHWVLPRHLHTLSRKASSELWWEVKLFFPMISLVYWLIDKLKHLVKLFRSFISRLISSSMSSPTLSLHLLLFLLLLLNVPVKSQYQQELIILPQPCSSCVHYLGEWQHLNFPNKKFLSHLRVCLLPLHIQLITKRHQFSKIIK